LLRDLEKDEIFRTHTPTYGWLAGKIVIDIAKLAGEPLGARKKPIPWGIGGGKQLVLRWVHLLDILY
jgi:hypothetical protein